MQVPDLLRLRLQEAVDRLPGSFNRRLSLRLEIERALYAQAREAVRMLASKHDIRLCPSGREEAEEDMESILQQAVLSALELLNQYAPSLRPTTALSAADKATSSLLTPPPSS